VQTSTVADQCEEYSCNIVLRLSVIFRCCVWQSTDNECIIHSFIQLLTVQSDGMVAQC